MSVYHFGHYVPHGLARVRRRSETPLVTRYRWAEQGQKT